jgi:hypothetical protein
VGGLTIGQVKNLSFQLQIKTRARRALEISLGSLLFQLSVKNVASGFSNLVLYRNRFVYN